MAQGLMRHTAPTQIAVTSAGTHAKTAVNDLSAQVLAELGIDASDHQPTQLTDTLIGAADLVVVVGTFRNFINWLPEILGYMCNAAAPANTIDACRESDEPASIVCADVERSHMAAPDQLCDERPGVAGSVTVVVVGGEPKRLRPPPVGIRTWSPRHTPIMRRELGWVAHDVLGSCLQ